MYNIYICKFTLWPSIPGRIGSEWCGLLRGRRRRICLPGAQLLSGAGMAMAIESLVEGKITENLPQTLVSPICISMYIYVYLCISIYMYIYICIYVFMYICIYVYMYICIYVYMYMCVNVYMYICVYVYVCECIYVYMYICVNVYMYMHVNMYIYSVYMHNQTKMHVHSEINK